MTKANKNLEQRRLDALTGSVILKSVSTKL